MSINKYSLRGTVPKFTMRSNVTETSLVDADATLTMTQLKTYKVTIPVTEPRTLTLPTAAELVASMPQIRMGEGVDFMIENTGGPSSVVVAMGDGGTLNGSGTVPSGCTNRFFIRVDVGAPSGSETYSCISLGLSNQYSLRTFSPMDYGAKGDAVTNDAPAIQAAINAAQAHGNFGTTIDLGGLKYMISTTLVFSNDNVVFRNGHLAAHNDFPEGNFAIELAGSGNRITNIWITGFKGGISGDSAQCWMNGILYTTGIQEIDHVWGWGFPSYGIRVTDGGTGRISFCHLRQWGGAMTQSGNNADRTATLYCIETGDIWVTDCIGSRCKYPAAVVNGGSFFCNCHFFNGSVVGGDVVTTYRQYSAFVDPGSRATFSTCYLDNGAVLAADSNTTIIGCFFLMRDTYTYDPVAVEFRPNNPDIQLDGFTMTDCTLTGYKNGLPFASTDFFDFNFVNGSFLANGSKNVHVGENVYYRSGIGEAPVPTTTGGVTISAPTARWAAEGAYFVTKSVALSDYIFAAPYIRYVLTTGLQVPSGGTDFAAPAVTIDETNSTTKSYRFIAAAAPTQDLNINLQWFGDFDETLTVPA